MQSGFIAIVGPTNVGKSTFLNQVLGFKLAITSDKPQTTRHRLLGVMNRPDLQMVFLDTPGLHQAHRALNRRMVETAWAALQEVDACLVMVAASPRGMREGAPVARRLAAAGPPAVLALNKIDRLADKQELLPFLQEAQDWGPWRALVPISALKGDGSGRVIAELARLLPEGPPLFPADTITDLNLRFLAAELIREKVIRLTGQEVPYASAVTLEQFLEPQEEGRPVAISATIHLERKGQKAIVIGKGGSLLKKIGIAARRDIERLLGQKVFLDLFVRVEPKWTRQAHRLQKLGY